MSVSEAARPSHTKQEPDLFFPASDSEDDDEVTAVPLPSSTIAADLSSSSTTLRQNGSASHRKGISPNNGDVKPLVGSQGSDIVPLDWKPDFSTPTAGPSKLKRPSPSRSPSSNIPPSFTDGYLGEFVCEGWSLSKGKGYCVPGSEVIFERPKAAKMAEDDSKILARSKDKIGPARLVNGKVVNAKAKPVGGKQVTLGALGMGKKAASTVSQNSVPRCSTDDREAHEKTSREACC